MKNLIKLVIYILIAVIVYITIISIFIYPCQTKGMSMFPTISPNEIKITNRWRMLTNNQDLKRGEIVIFEEPSVMYVPKEQFDEKNILAKYDNKIRINPFRERLMKRVIGQPNDHIQITEDGILYINGKIYYEDYVEDGYTSIEQETYMEYMYIDIIVPENSIYVMGDNRTNSTDSRAFGCVPINKVYSVLF